VELIAAGWWTANHLLVVLNAVLATAATATAIVGVATIKSSNRVAAAAEEHVDATIDLVREQQYDRELVFSPMVAPNVSRGQVEGDGAGRPYTQWLTFSNVGKGPALNLYYIGTDGNSWCWLRHPGLGAEQMTTDQFMTSPEQGEPPWELLEPGPTDDEKNNRLGNAVFCEDVMGNRIRFGRTRDVSRLGDENQPAWAKSPIVWQ